MPDSRLATRPEDRPMATERPILWQAKKDLSEFSKAQGIPAMIMGFGTFVAAIVLGQVTSAWSAFWLLLLSIVAGLVFYALIAIIRAPFIVIAQHHRQLSDVNQRLIEVEARSFDAAPSPSSLALPPPETPSQVVPAEIAATSMEFSDYEIVDRWLSPDVHGFISREPTNLTGGMRASDLVYPIVLARFYYRPLRDVPPVVYVKAHIVVTDSQGATLRPRYDAVWDVDFENEYKGFSTAATHALSIGLLPKQDKHEFITYEYGYRDSQFAPVFTQLEGKEFVLEVELIGKVNNTTVLNAPMRFLLTLEPRPELTQLT